jgi:putative FmdB family regulatory protein
MPTYEYACTACDHRFERFESIKAKPDTSCPKCKKKKAERQISAGGGFLFKGTGFYVTDYKKTSAGGGGGDSGAPAKTADAGHSCTGACSHGGGDAKPAKTENKSGKVA